jgi:phytanoyl-CoA hydroxylase
MLNFASKFTRSHAERFFRDGAVVVEDYAPAAMLEQLKEEILRLISVEAASRKAVPSAAKATNFDTYSHDHTSEHYFHESGDKIRFFLEKGCTEVSPGSVNKIAHALHTDGGVFQKFTTMMNLGSVARQIGRRSPTVVQSMAILKPPKVGGEVGPHQDNTWIGTSPFSCVGFWFALDDAYVANSCLLGLPGSHFTHRELSAVSRLNAEGVKADLVGELPKVSLDSLVPLECKAGSLVIFDGLFIHASTANTSDRKRHAYVVHVVDDMCSWKEDNWFGKYVARLSI